MSDNKWDTIVFFTAHYPYEHGEEFVENEIEYMVANSKKVIIIPLGVRDYSCSRLTLEYIKKGNFIVMEGCREKGFSRFLTDLRGVFLLKVWKEFFLNKKVYDIGIKEWIHVVDYSSQYRRLRYIILDFLNVNIDDGDRIVFYSYWLGIGSALAASFKPLYAGAIVISRCHGSDLYHEVHSKNYIPYRAESIIGLDYVFSISEAGCRYLEQEFSQLKNKIFCSRLGTFDFGINETVKTGWFTIVSCSNLISVKRVQLIILALAMCKQQIKWIHFGDGPLQGKLQLLAERVLPSNVRWSFKGRISNKDLMCEYRKFPIDLFINVSASEGIPVSIMEALSFGIPILATDVGGVRECVIDGYNGHLLTGNLDARMLYQEIRKFMDELKDKSVEYRLNARDSWKNKYNAENNYNIFYNNVKALYQNYV